MSNIQQISTKGILCRDNKILLVKDDKGKWELPGGRINFLETPEQALKREFFEELSFRDITIGKIFDAWSFTIEKSDYYHFIILIFEVSTNEEKIVLDTESLDYNWFSLEEILQLDIRDGYKKSIKKFYLCRKMKDNY